MNRDKVWWTAFVLLMILMVAGCGQAPSKPASTDKQMMAKPTEKMSVKIAPGPLGAVLWLPAMVAEGNGNFQEHNIDLTVVPTPGGNEAAKALMSRETDFALLAFDHVLKNRAQGADLVVVSFLTKDPGLIMIVQSDLQGKVTSIKDLKGKKIGVSSLGGGTHMAVLSLLKQAGMTETDVEVVAAKDKLVSMWDAKQVSAAMHTDPQVSELLNNNRAWILHDLRKSKDTVALYGTDYPLGTLVTRQDVIQKNPEMVQRVVDAVMAANQFIKTHSAAEVAAKVPPAYKGDSKLYETMVMQNVEGLALSGTVSPESMNTVLKELREKKAIPADSTVDITSSVNLTFISKAPK